VTEWALDPPVFPAVLNSASFSLTAAIMRPFAVLSHVPNPNSKEGSVTTHSLTIEPTGLSDRMQV
jgi:hypothetical protein